MTNTVYSVGLMGNRYPNPFYEMAKNYGQADPQYYDYPVIRTDDIIYISKKKDSEKNDKPFITTGKVVTGLAIAGTIAYLIKSGKFAQAWQTAKGYGEKGINYVKNFFTAGKGKTCVDATKKFFTEGKGKVITDNITKVFKKGGEAVSKVTK